MGAISLILNHSLVEYIPDLQLTSTGEWRCKCPLHGGDNPSSFVVYPSTNTFYCFGGGYDETRFDVYCNSVNEAMRNGRQYVEVEVIE